MTVPFGSPARPEPPPLVAWENFWPWFRRDWQQGEHVSIVGPTGTGKTTLGMAILARRAFGVVLGTKPRDAGLSRLLSRGGYELVRELPVEPDRTPRVAVWPPYRRMGDITAQRAAIARTFEDAFIAGGWCLFADEVSYLCRDLGLGDRLRTLWQQGRSLNLSLVAATQRPAWVPLDLYSAPTHLFLFRTNDERDLARIGGLNGMSPKVVRAAVAELDRFEALYVNTRRGQTMRTRYRDNTPRRATA